jgi:hypothetical protein
LRPEGTFGISPSFLGLSQSSGQVTHVLLTRSRLCPRPKPGSSLHLHVLGTPPAFVLSQDQTLREELHKESSGVQTRISEHNRGHVPDAGKTLGLSLVGQDPCALTREPEVHRWAPERKTGSILAPPFEQPDESGKSSDGVEPGHTPRPRNRSKGAHAVEFSKTVAPLQEGFPPQTARPEPVIGSRGGPTSIALEIARNTEFPLPGRAERRSAAAQLTTWTATVRSRGRSSKSIRTICCHVPSARRPSTSGIDSEGPMIAAR